jgi:competence protein ComEA
MSRAAAAALLLALFAAPALALEINVANRAQLEQLRGIGPPLADAILAEREARGAYRDWADLMGRVKGIRAAKATSLSQAGLRVGQAAFER